MYSNIDRAIFSIQENAGLVNGSKKYTNMTISNTTDTTIHNFQKLTLTIPSGENNCTRNNFVSASLVCKNNSNVCESIINTDNNTLNQINTSSKIEINDIYNIEDRKRNVQPKTRNKKQKNISFTSQKLWEINRVNQILHKKINNGTKNTNSKPKTSTIFIKATSTINRERKNKDIVKENEVSWVMKKVFILNLFSNKNEIFLL